jgi:hypothetical protein
MAKTLTFGPGERLGVAGILVGLAAVFWPPAIAASVGIPYVICEVAFFHLRRKEVPMGTALVCIALILMLVAAAIGTYGAVLMDSTKSTVDATEKTRREQILARLTNLYILSHDGITPAIAARIELPPSAWLNAELERMGEKWRLP